MKPYRLTGRCVVIRINTSAVLNKLLQRESAVPLSEPVAADNRAVLKMQM